MCRNRLSVGTHYQICIINYLLDTKTAGKDVLQNLDSSKISDLVLAPLAALQYRSSSNRRAGFGKLLVFRFSPMAPGGRGGCSAPQSSKAASQFLFSCLRRVKAEKAPRPQPCSRTGTVKGFSARARRAHLPCPRSRGFTSHRTSHECWRREAHNRNRFGSTA